MSGAPILFYMPGSCALSCHIALEWAGTDYELKRLSRSDLTSESFRDVNPKGKVPALRMDDGTVITEALAILVHIAVEHARAGGLLPERVLQRAQMLEALSEMTGEFHPAFFPIHVPGRFTDEEAGFDGVKRAAQKRVRTHYDRWNDRMSDGDWVLGDTRSVADPYLFVMCRWAGVIDARIAEWPNLAAFTERMKADEAVLRALQAEGLEP